MATLSAAAANDAVHLRTTRSEDIDELMSWFTDQESIASWGGPAFRHPFTPETFHEDCRWQDMASFVLVNSNASIVGFGQLYERSGRTHLARIAVNPDLRNRGYGRILMRKLLEQGDSLFGFPEYSLFVLMHNTSAQRLYSSVGFEIREFPPNAPLQDICYYMTLSK